jgi:hypothetical protein
MAAAPAVSSQNGGGSISAKAQHVFDQVGQLMATLDAQAADIAAAEVAAAKAAHSTVNPSTSYDWADSLAPTKPLAAAATAAAAATTAAVSPPAAAAAAPKAQQQQPRQQAATAQQGAPSAPAPPATVQAAKAALLDAVYGTARGLDASQDQRWAPAGCNSLLMLVALRQAACCLPREFGCIPSQVAQAAACSALKRSQRCMPLAAWCSKVSRRCMPACCLPLPA